MNENENNFESLRRLLTLKRHEIPPPGYFKIFPAQVISRIRAGEANASASISERLFAEAPWFSKLVQAFEFKPAFAGAFASALCFAARFRNRFCGATRLRAATVFAGDDSKQRQRAVSLPLCHRLPLPQTDQTGIIATTNPVLNLQPVATLFGQQNPFAPASQLFTVRQLT